MPLTPADLAWVRGHIGDSTPPSDDDLNDAFDLLGSRSAVALDVWRKRRAEFASRPAKMDLDGEVSQDTSANVKMIDTILDDPELYDPGEDDGDGVDAPNQLRVIPPARQRRR